MKHVLDYDDFYHNVRKIYLRNKNYIDEKIENSEKIVNKTNFGSGWMLGGNFGRTNGKTSEEYSKLKEGNHYCYLCGEKASGIDRIDSNKNYTEINNIKPACWTCNRMKSDLKLDDFLIHIGCIITHKEHVSDEHVKENYVVEDGLELFPKPMEKERCVRAPDRIGKRLLIRCKETNEVVEIIQTIKTLEKMCNYAERTIRIKLRDGSLFPNYNVYDITKDKTEYIVNESLKKQFYDSIKS